jgi:hypothetical protein
LKPFEKETRGSASYARSRGMRLWDGFSTLLNGIFLGEEGKTRITRISREPRRRWGHGECGMGLCNPFARLVKDIFRGGRLEVRRAEIAVFQKLVVGEMGCGDGIARLVKDIFSAGREGRWKRQEAEHGPDGLQGRWDRAEMVGMAQDCACGGGVGCGIL